MSKKILKIDDNTSFLPEHGVIVAIAAEPTAVPSTAPKPKAEGGANSIIAPWGENNDYPQQILKEAEGDTELLPLLEWKGRVLQGREVVAVNLVWDDGKKDFKVERINDEEITKFLNTLNWKRYWREACVDFTYFQNIFPDLIKSKDNNRIAIINTHDASWCRWGVMDNDGNIKKCFVSAEWQDGAKADDKTKVMEHPVIDPYDPEVIEKIKNDKKVKRFVYHANYPSPGRAYYPIAGWHSFLFSDWFQIKKNVAKWKRKFMERVLSAKFIITIPTNYWPAVHKDWESKSKEEKLKIKKEKVKEINDSLTGLEGAGSSILSEVGFDHEGKELPAIKIIPIESGFKDGEHLEDSQEASQHLNRALNVDSTLVGSGPSRGNDAGSGSDKRVAFNIYTAILQPFRDVILEPLYFIADYNGWTDRYPNIRFKVLEVDIQTLDQGPTSKETNPVTPAK